MNEFVLYNLRTAACLAGFYLFYKLLLSRETLHRFNRIVLLLITVLSFVLPLCVVTIERVLPPTEEFRMEPLSIAPAMPVEMPVSNVSPAEHATAPTPFPWREATLVLLLAGAFGALAWSAGSLAGVMRVIRRGRHEPLDGKIVLVRTPEQVTPFSWLRYIVLSDRDYRESGPQIIAHERAHIRLRHSLDLLLTDLCSCLQWFNPAMWLLRQELRAIHEYEADEAVLRSGADAKSYQMLLIKKAVGGRWYSVANSLNHSNLKSRITMMLRKRSSRWAAAKALLLLPLVCVALGAFARTAYVVADNKVTQNSENPQGFTGWMGIAPDGEGRMRFELEGEGDAIRGALGLMNYYTILRLGEEPRSSDFVRELATVVESPVQAVAEYLRPLVLVDSRPIGGMESLPGGDRIASIILYDPAAARAAFGEQGAQGAVAIVTRQAGAPNPAVQQALQPQEAAPDKPKDRSCWFTGRNLTGEADGGLSMSGSFAPFPLTDKELQTEMESWEPGEREVPVEWEFNGKCTFRMDGEDRAVATVYGYGDAMMAAASMVNPLMKPGKELPAERRRLGKILYRLSRTAAASPEWLAVPMPLTLVDGQRITRMEEVPDAARILRIEALGSTTAMREYGSEGAAGAVRITTKAEGSNSDAEVEAERRKGASVSSCMSEQGPQPGKGGFYFEDEMPTIEQADAYIELPKKHMPAMQESMARNGIEDLDSRMQTLYDSILRVRPAGGYQLAEKLMADQFSGQLSCRVPDSERAIFFLAGKGDGMMAAASCLWRDYMPLSRIVYRLSFDGRHSTAWQAFPMPYTLVDDRQITSGEQVPDAARIYRIDVLGKELARRRFGAEGADGAVLIRTKPAGVGTDALVDAEKNHGAGLMSAAVTSFGLESPGAEMEGFDEPDPTVVREPARKVKGVGSASFSGSAAFVHEVGGLKATCHLAGKGDGMMAIASQMRREAPTLSNLAYRLSKKGASARGWKAMPMPYTLVDGRRIERATQVPDARYIAQVVILSSDYAEIALGPDGASGAVLIVTKEPEDDNREAVEKARARGANFLSAGSMSYEADSPEDVLRLAAEEAIRSATTVKVIVADEAQTMSLQTSPTTASGEAGARNTVHRIEQVNRIELCDKEGKSVMTMMTAGDSVRFASANTPHEVHAE